MCVNLLFFGRLMQDLALVAMSILRPCISFLKECYQAINTNNLFYQSTLHIHTVLLEVILNSGNNTFKLTHTRLLQNNL